MKLDQGDVVADYLRHGRLPEAHHVDDPFGAASAALAFPFSVEPLESHSITVRIPLDKNLDAFAPHANSMIEALREATDYWSNLPAARIDLPPVAQDIEQTLYLGIHGPRQLHVLLVGSGLGALDGPD